MKFTVEQAAFQKALARVVSVVPRRNTIPVLGNVLLDAESDAGVVWLVATDLDMEARVRVQAEIATPGRITVPATLIDGIARNAPGGSEIMVDYDPSADPRALVRFGRSRYVVPVLPADLFPVWSDKTPHAVLTLKAVDLVNLIDRTTFAASTDAAFLHLRGAYVHAPDPATRRVRFVSTNGHRAAWAEAEVQGALDALPNVIAPTKALAEFRRAADGRVGDVVLSMDPASITLEADDMRICSKVLDGDFVNYERVIPRDWRPEALMDRSLVIGAVLRTALMSSDTRTSPITLRFEEDLLKLNVRSDTSGQAAEEVEIEYGGDPFEMGFNSRYLLDALRQTEADRIVFRLLGPASPLRLEPSPDDPEHGSALSIVMPQRV